MTSPALATLLALATVSAPSEPVASAAPHLPAPAPQSAVAAGVATSGGEMTRGSILPDTLILFVASEGNRARYRVREQLASLDFPNDAVGETSSIQGQLIFLPDGSFDTDRSRITIDMTSLRSDSDRRDNFLRRNTLQSEQFPGAVLVPTGFEGLPFPLPSEGEHGFTLLGDFILKGERHPTRWEVTATFAGGAILGQARTILTFDGVGLTKPRVASVLSVADDIRLEYDFRLTPTR